MFRVEIFVDIDRDLDIGISEHVSNVSQVLILLIHVINK